MADETTDPVEGQAPIDTPPAAENPPADPPADAGASEDALPEWAKKELAKARSEAAKYRTSLRDAETRLTGAKTAEEFEAAKAELLKSNRALERALVATKHGLPEALAKRLDLLGPEVTEDAFNDGINAAIEAQWRATLAKSPRLREIVERARQSIVNKKPLW